MSKFVCNRCGKVWPTTVAMKSAAAKMYVAERDG